MAFITPFLLFSPIAGAMVDRYNHKLMMMVSDLGAALSTVAILILYVTGLLQFWHLHIAAVINGLGNTFQWPACSAAISTMVSKEQYGRANGMMSLVDAGPGVLAPVLAGAILAISIQGMFDSFALIMLIDLLTFLLAIGALLLVHVLQPEKTAEGEKAAEDLWERIPLHLRAPQLARTANGLPRGQFIRYHRLHGFRSDDPGAHRSR